MKISRRLLVAPVAALATTALVAPLAAAQAAPPSTHVVPSQLPTGDPLHLPTIEHDTLIVPGHDPVSLASLGKVPTALHRARGGYLVDFRVVTGSTVRTRVGFVSDAGRKRVVRKAGPWSVAAVASDGRTFVAGKERPRRGGHYLQGQVLQRFRVSDGRAVGRQLTVSGYDSVLALTPTRALLGYVPLNGPQDGKPRTLWWTTGTGRVRIIATSPSWFFGIPQVQAASLRGHAVSVARGHHQVVLDTRTGQRRWMTASDTAVQTFSPDGSRALTVGQPAHVGEEESEEYVVRRILVRKAGSGAVVASFSGVFDFNAPFFVGTHWESNDVFVTLAYERIDDSNVWPTPTGPALVRCRISTATCERLPGSSDTGAIWLERASS